MVLAEVHVAAHNFGAAYEALKPVCYRWPASPRVWNTYCRSALLSPKCLAHCPKSDASFCSFWVLLNWPLGCLYSRRAGYQQGGMLNVVVQRACFSAWLCGSSILPATGRHDDLSRPKYMHVTRLTSTCRLLCACCACPYAATPVLGLCRDWSSFVCRVLAGMGGTRHSAKFLLPLRAKYPSSLPLMLLAGHSLSQVTLPPPCPHPGPGSPFTYELPFFKLLQEWQFMPMHLDSHCDTVAGVCSRKHCMSSCESPLYEIVPLLDRSNLDSEISL